MCWHRYVCHSVIVFDMQNARPFATMNFLYSKHSFSDAMPIAFVNLYLPITGRCRVQGGARTFSPSSHVFLLLDPFVIKPFPERET